MTKINKLHFNWVDYDIGDPNIHDLTAKSLIVPADELVIADSADSYKNKKTTFANLVPSCTAIPVVLWEAVTAGDGKGAVYIDTDWKAYNSNAGIIGKNLVDGIVLDSGSASDTVRLATTWLIPFTSTTNFDALLFSGATSSNWSGTLKGTDTDIFTDTVDHIFYWINVTNWLWNWTASIYVDWAFVCNYFHNNENPCYIPLKWIVGKTLWISLHSAGNMGRVAGNSMTSRTLTIYYNSWGRDWEYVDTMTANMYYSWNYIIWKRLGNYLNIKPYRHCFTNKMSVRNDGSWSSVTTSTFQAERSWEMEYTFIAWLYNSSQATAECIVQYSLDNTNWLNFPSIWQLWANSGTNNTTTSIFKIPIKKWYYYRALFYLSNTNQVHVTGYASDIIYY